MIELVRLINRIPFGFTWLPFCKHATKISMLLWMAGNVFAMQLGNDFLNMDNRKLEALQEISYVESLEYVENPGIGFYVPVYVHYKETENQVPEYSGKLLHLRLDISEFGTKNGKAGEELSADMLRAFEELLGSLERDGSCAIVRFAYDPWFSGRQTYEPSMEMVLLHQEQLGEVMSRHSETIISVECGLFGKWGEMHGSAACSQENFNLAIDQWLSVLPESIPISVRTPSQYCGWCGITVDELAGQITDPGQKEYRVGIYNDGYLASDTDLGTYVNRKKEVEWLSHQAKHTVFGGEAGATYGKKGEIGLTSSYVEKEAYITHLTYLNGFWNEPLVNALKSEVYEGSDERYLGGSGYDYVRNHMGYRFVLRGVRVTKENPQGKKLKLEVDVENVGFANLVKPKEVTILLVDMDRDLCYSFSGAELLNLEDGSISGGDPTKWDSRETMVLRASIPITEKVSLGQYRVYLRIARPEAGSTWDRQKGESDYSVRFANEGDALWEDSFAANFLGTIMVTEPPEKLEWDYGLGILNK
jgi:hypothetical protein